MVLITLCMIVKNEEKNLSKCLESVLGFIDEIVIVDTGSTDRTKEIALKYTDKVFGFQWINDFAAARNYAVSKAKNEYILVLDADETLISIHKTEIHKLIESNPLKVGRIRIESEFTRNGSSSKNSEWVSRFFSKKYYQYQGVIHEQIVPIVSDEKEYPEIPNSSTLGDTYLLPLTVAHSGYEGNLEVRKGKTERNINMLEQALQQTPDDPYLLYQLGKSYYMQEEHLKASDYFGQALYFDLDTRLEYVQDLVESYGYALLNSEQYDKALQLLNVYDEFAHSADFIFLVALILMNTGSFQQAIEGFQKAAAKSESKMEGANSYLANYNIGVIYECLGNKEQAKIYYKKCSNYEPALKQLENLAQ